MNRLLKNRVLRQVRSYLPFYLFTFLPFNVAAQQVLTLDSCRAMALRNNKQLSVSRVKQQIATNLRKSARTKYLPHVSALGGYEWTSREISLLSDEQKESLKNIGTTTAASMGGKASQALSNIPESTWQVLGSMGITPQGVSQSLGSLMNGMGTDLNALGSRVVDAFRTDTRNMFAGAVMVTQPVFMGGAIVAVNKMADINEDLAANRAEGQLQNTLFNIDQTYWQVVSLKHKQKLAKGYLELVQKLDSDVKKMIEEGVATRSEGLSVAVRVNEAEMAVTQVSDGLVLSKMLLCQLCGIPYSEGIVLSDEDSEDISGTSGGAAMSDLSAENRPELKMLQNAVDMSHQLTNVLKAGNLPQVALMGGYLVTNPNLYNGYQNKFGGVWNIGVMVRVPLWNWGDVAYKVRAAKGANTIAKLELDDAREKIGLQVNQSTFRVTEASKKLAMANASVDKANENLRTANLGFSEGVISSTTVMEAQTAWLQAQSQKIDAEIEVKLSEVNLQKALGTLR
jgi:outer membrane protein TolC